MNISAPIVVATALSILCGSACDEPTSIPCESHEVSATLLDGTLWKVGGHFDVDLDLVERSAGTIRYETPEGAEYQAELVLEMAPEADLEKDGVQTLKGTLAREGATPMPISVRTLAAEPLAEGLEEWSVTFDTGPAADQVRYQATFVTEVQRRTTEHRCVVPSSGGGAGRGSVGATQLDPRALILLYAL